MQSQAAADDAPEARCPCVLSTLPVGALLIRRSRMPIQIPQLGNAVELIIVKGLNVYVQRAVLRRQLLDIS